MSEVLQYNKNFIYYTFQVGYVYSLIKIFLLKWWVFGQIMKNRSRL